MSMVVDLNTPLTDEERAYLSMRGRYADIQRVDALHGSEAQPLGDGDGTGPKHQALTTSEARAERRQAILEELRLLEAADGNPDDDTETDPNAVAPYEEWTHKELDAELKRRDLAKGGNVQEKAQRLYDDDAASYQEQNA